MQAQLVLVGSFLGVSVAATALMATGHVPGAARAVDAWSAARPAIPRRWLEAAFWSSMALSVTAIALLFGTIEGALPAVWNDVGQVLIWTGLAMDAVISGRRLWTVFAAAFLVFSGYQVASHL